MKLYGFHRSSASFRARIALELKGLEVEHVSVALPKGENRTDAYRALNPSGSVPTLVDGEHVLRQSMAIIEYLDETHPEPPLLPSDAPGRARVRALAHTIVSDMHTVSGMRAANYLQEHFGASKHDQLEWTRHWMRTPFESYEAQLTSSPATGRFSHGDTPTLADICLVPHVFNARAIDFDFSAMPTLMRIFEACMALPAFDRAQPSRQPDANPV